MTTVNLTIQLQGRALEHFKRHHQRIPYKLEAALPVDRPCEFVKVRQDGSLSRCDASAAEHAAGRRDDHFFTLNGS